MSRLVIGGQAGLFEAARLIVVEHAERDARFHAERAHAADHRQHVVERGAVFDLAPGGAHAEAGGAGGPGAAGGVEHLGDGERALGADRRLVVRALRAV